MFKDYKEYIENIRNNLIQNDIQVPEFDLEGYADVFKYSFILEQVCWFYQMLLLMNSEYAVKSRFLYSESYQEKVRQLAYKDFIDYKESYKLLSSRYQLLEELKSKAEGKVQGYVDKDEVIDLFGSDEEAINDDYISTFLDTIINSSNGELKNVEEDFKSLEDVVQLNKLDGMYVPHGIFIDEYYPSFKQAEENENSGYVPNGIFIDMFISKKEVITDGTRCEEPNTASVPHGVYIDEWVSEKHKNNYKEHGIFIDEYVKKVKSPVIEEGYQKHGLFIDEWVKDEKDFTSKELDVRSDWLEGEDWSDSWSDEWSEEPIAEDVGYEDDEYEDAEEDEWSQVGDFNGVSGEYTPKETSTINKDVKVEKSDSTRDVSDSIQDITNQLLTEGKRLVYKGLKKLQE